MITVERVLPPIRELAADFVVNLIGVAAVLVAVFGYDWDAWWLLLAGWFVRDAAGTAGQLVVVLSVHAALADAELDADSPIRGEQP